MQWFVTLLVLAVLAWLLLKMLRGRADSGTTNPESLEHDGNDTERPLPGQRAAIDGEIQDAVRGRDATAPKPSPEDRAEHERAPDAGTGGSAAPGREGERSTAAGGVSPGMAAEVAATGVAGAGEVGAAAGERASRDVAAPNDDTLSGAGGTPSPEGGLDDGGAGEGTHRVEASVRTQPDASSASPSITDSPGDESAKLAVPGSPDPSAPDGRGDAPPDAATAARRAHETADTGGTGTAVLDGIATTASVDEDPGRTNAGRADERHHANESDPSGTEGSALTNPPDPNTAGALELEGRSTDTASTLREHSAPGRADTSGAAARQASDSVERAGQSARDNSATNAPIGDAAAGEAARASVDVPAANVAAAEPAATPSTPERRANDPDEDTAGGLRYRDRSVGARSTLAAGTVTLGVGGATAALGRTVLEDGRSPEGQADGGAGSAAETGKSTMDSDERAALDGGDSRTGVREMMKMLNLHESDASRLGISRDDFALLWRRDESAPTDLVDEVGARLRRMLG